MTILDDVVSSVRAEVARRQAKCSLDQVKSLVAKQNPAKDVLSSLRDGPGAVSIIAEVKRSSFSGEFLSDISNPGLLADMYQAGGARMVSVITDKPRFGGSLADLDAVRETVDLPILRKDFIVTPYQVHESRAHGADAVLLIAAALEQPALVSLVERVRSLGMTAMVEANSRLEAFRALDAGAQLIGVNAYVFNRLEFDENVIEQVIDVIPSDVTAVAESGVSTARDVLNYALSGADAVLVGGALVTSNDPTELLRDMVSAGQHPALLTDRKRRVRANWKSI